MSAIAAERVSKVWTTAEGAVRAVDDVSFAFDAGTLNVLLACRDTGVERLLHTSTSEVYGTARSVPISEVRFETDAYMVIIAPMTAPIENMRVRDRPRILRNLAIISDWSA